MNEDAMIRVEELEVRRDSFTLKIPDWKVAPGQVIGLVGPNGAGKTTLLETLAGLLPADSGNACVFGLDPWREPVKVRSSLGFMSDDLPLFALRIDQLLRMLSGYYATWDPELVQELLERYKLDATRSVEHLSRGEATRIRLVTAMAFRPRLLLLDEPAAGMDLSGRRSLMQSVLDAVRDPQRTVIISSHMLNDVERIADRILVLNEGRVIKEGPIDKLVSQDQTLEEALEKWGAAG